MSTPAIIVVAYNRPSSFSRLLTSIENASYELGDIPLCICIDYQDSDLNRDVVRIAEEFIWKHGSKVIIHQKENIGLKNHVLMCGDLTERYGDIIMLEDDLFVSPSFYDYATLTLNFYRDHGSIGGISLYNHKIDVSNRLPFIPLHDGSDVYFLQVASSWGQAWTAKQWNGFRRWLSKNPTILPSVNIPSFILNWPDKSWLKHFIHFLVSENKYFVYPRISLTTNFGETGENSSHLSSQFQVPILQGKYSYKLVELSESNSLYDVYFDIKPESLKVLAPQLKNLNFSVNFSGLKRKESVHTEYVFVAQKCFDPILSYSLQLKPVELNVVHKIEGCDLSLVKTENSDNFRSTSFSEKKEKVDYYWGVRSTKSKLRDIASTIMAKLTNR